MTSLLGACVPSGAPRYGIRAAGGSATPASCPQHLVSTTCTSATHSTSLGAQRFLCSTRSSLAWTPLDTRSDLHRFRPRLSLAWTSKLGASVYSSPSSPPPPVALPSGPTPSCGTSRRSTGRWARPAGWPHAADATFHTSPLADDEDGIDEMLLSPSWARSSSSPGGSCPPRARYRLQRPRAAGWRGCGIHMMPFKVGHALVDHGHDDDASGRAAEPEPSADPRLRPRRALLSDESQFGQDIGAHGALSARRRGELRAVRVGARRRRRRAFDEEGGAGGARRAAPRRVVAKA